MRLPSIAPNDVLRVVTGLAIVGAADVWNARLIVPAEVLDPHVTIALTTVVIGAASAVLVGWRTRAASIALAASMSALVALLQTNGTPLHMHHLAWLAIILATSRAGATKSLDARGARSGATEDDGALACARLVIALVYFFPGVHKLLDARSPFFDTDALARLVRLKALEAGGAPPLHLDAHPSWILAGAVLVVAAELALPLLAWRAPRLACAAIVGLHTAFGIALHMPYLVLGVFALLFVSPAAREWRARASSIPRAIRVGVVVAVSIAGALGAMRGPLFVCYPTFAVPVPREIATLVVEVDRGTGFIALTHTALAPDTMRTPIVAASRRVRSERDARAFVSARMRDPAFAAAVSDARAIRVSRAVIDLTARLAAPTHATPIATFALAEVRE